MAVRVDGDRLDCAQPAKRKTNEKKSSSSSSRSRTGTRRRKFLLLDLRVCTVHALQSYPVMEEEIVKKKRETFFFLSLTSSCCLVVKDWGKGEEQRQCHVHTPCMNDQSRSVYLCVFICARSLFKSDYIHTLTHTLGFHSVSIRLWLFEWVLFALGSKKRNKTKQIFL